MVCFKLQAVFNRLLAHQSYSVQQTVGTPIIQCSADCWHINHTVFNRLLAHQSYSVQQTVGTSIIPCATNWHDPQMNSFLFSFFFVSVLVCLEQHVLNSWNHEEKKGGLTRRAHQELHSWAPPAGRWAWHVLIAWVWAMTSEPRVSYLCS